MDCGEGRKGRYLGWMNNGPVLWPRPVYGGRALPAPLFLPGRLAREPVAQLPRPDAGDQERLPEPSFELRESAVFLFLCQTFLEYLWSTCVVSLMRLASLEDVEDLFVGLSCPLHEPFRLLRRRKFPIRPSLKGFEERDDLVVDLVCLLDKDQVPGVVFNA